MVYASVINTPLTQNVFLLIVQWLVGFYLQVIPVAVICIYPFRGHFKVSNRHFYSIILAAIVVLSLCWVTIVAREYFGYDGASSNYRSIADIFFFIALIILLCVYYFGIDAKPIFKLFIFVLGMNYGFAVEVTNRTINYFTQVYAKEVMLYSIDDIFHYLIINGVLMYPMLKLVTHIKEGFDSGISQKIWKTLTLVQVGVLLFLALFYELPYVTNLNPLYVLYLFISALYFFVLLLYYWIFSVIREERTNERNQAKWEFLAKSYKLEEENLEEIRKLRHEIRHHLLALQLYLRDGDYVGAEEYLDKVLDLENDLPVQTFSSDNLLNLILSDYDRRMSEKKISFWPEISVNNKIKIEDMDLIELFSNLLDNAIEATDKRENDQEVKLTIKQNGNFLTVQCDNTYDEDNIIRSGNRFVSNKPNSFVEQHGIGMGVMSEIVRKYNGFIDFETNGDIFTVLINLSTVPEGAF